MEHIYQVKISFGDGTGGIHGYCQTKLGLVLLLEKHGIPKYLDNEEKELGAQYEIIMDLWTIMKGKDSVVEYHANNHDIRLHRMMIEVEP